MRTDGSVQLTHYGCSVLKTTIVCASDQFRMTPVPYFARGYSIGAAPIRDGNFTLWQSRLPLAKLSTHLLSDPPLVRTHYH